MNPRSVVLYLAHAWSPVHSLRFRRLRQQTEGIADCYVLYQSSSADVPDALRQAAAHAIHVFQSAELPARLGYRYLTPSGLVPGCVHYPLIDFSRQHPYRHYWLIEHDVEFSGDWATLLRAGDATQAGLLASHLRRYSDTPGWVWWRSLWAPFPGRHAVPWRLSKRCKAFLPVFRISCDALRLIDRLHQAGCVGHSEVLLPTAIRRAGLGVVDLNSLRVLYRGAEQDPVADVGRRSSLRWRPEVSLAEFSQTFTADTIYHPVKAEWTFDGANVLVTQPNGHATLPLSVAGRDHVPATDGSSCTAATSVVPPHDLTAGAVAAAPAGRHGQDAVGTSAIDRTQRLS